MTDNDIIKALEYCSVGAYVCDGDCPHFHSKKKLTVSSCRFELVGDALDLINRQKAEIESLKKYKDEIEQQLHYLNNVEIPYLYSFTEDKDKKLETIANILLDARRKAITEFEERLKAKAFLPLGTWCAERVITENDVDQTAKEMKGEQ